MSLIGRGGSADSPQDRDRVVKETQHYLETRDKIYTSTIGWAVKRNLPLVNSRGQAIWDPSGKPTGWPAR